MHLHSPRPQLASLPPPALRIALEISMGERKEAATQKRLRLTYLYYTEDERHAGSTLPASLRGPKKGIPPHQAFSTKRRFAQIHAFLSNHIFTPWVSST